MEKEKPLHTYDFLILAETIIFFVLIENFLSWLLAGVIIIFSHALTESSSAYVYHLQKTGQTESVEKTNKILAGPRSDTLIALTIAGIMAGIFFYCIDWFL